MKIRPYTSNDFAPVTQFWRHSREVALPEFERIKGHSYEEDCAYFKNHILVENDVYVVEINGMPVGFLAIKDDFIDRLYVAPKHQRQGIGRSLLEFARSLSPKHLWLYTLQINLNARTFYEKNGFVATKLGISPPPESEPDVMYEWNTA